MRTVAYQNACMQETSRFGSEGYQITAELRTSQNQILVGIVRGVEAYV